MTLDEQSLRSLLTSRIRHVVGRTVVNTAIGETLLVNMIDGTTRELPDKASALRVLREEFGWEPPK